MKRTIMIQDTVDGRLAELVESFTVEAEKTAQVIALTSGVEIIKRIHHSPISHHNPI